VEDERLRGGLSGEREDVADRDDVVPRGTHVGESAIEPASRTIEDRGTGHLGPRRHAAECGHTRRAGG
jgi:hypothetical protein